ncbi:tetratricopeptide repeat protein [Aquisphaera giovannonii]|nr:tetratricopeptide repeat protein [Aquisphaera giovannonii]
MRATGARIEVPGPSSTLAHQVKAVQPRSLLLTLIALAVAAASLAAWSFFRDPDPGEARAARLALEGGRLDEASAHLGRWLADQPKSAEAHAVKARLAWARGDYAAALEAMNGARALGHPDDGLVEIRGLLLAKANRPAEAEPLLSKAAASAPRIHPDVADALARIYLGEFRAGRAAEVIGRWMREWPDDARPYYFQTEIDHRNRAGGDVVIGHCRDALARDPGHLPARLRLADYLRLAHRSREAADEYAAYLRQKPDDALALLGAGLNALDLGDPAAATGFLDRALAVAPDDAVALGARASVEVLRHRPEAAMPFLDRAAKADPFDVNIRYQRVLILSQLGRSREAEAERRDLERLRTEVAVFDEIGRQLERHPLDVELRGRAARWLMAHGHEAEAAEWANLVLRSAPSDPAMNRLLADYHRRRGNPGLANFHEAHASPPEASPGRPPGP